MPRTSPSKTTKLKESARLKNLRLSLGLTQKMLASEFKTAQGAIAQWESGERTIPGPVLRLIEIYESKAVHPKKA